MDKDPELDAVDEERIAPRSGQDRRANDRRRSSNRLLELQARREGITDRRQQRERREDEVAEGDGWLRRASSFLRLLKADWKRP